jgi:class 3 adenylate cyclase
VQVSPGHPPSGVVTFLFTDVEGSTRRWESDAEAMRAALVVHDKVLRTAIEASAQAVNSPLRFRAITPTTFLARTYRHQRARPLQLVEAAQHVAGDADLRSQPGRGTRGGAGGWEGRQGR